MIRLTLTLLLLSLATWPSVGLASQLPEQHDRIKTNAIAWRIEIADDDGGVYPSLALDSAGLPHVSYGGNRAGTYIYGLKYAYHNGSAWQIEMVDEEISPGWETSIALDVLDHPHIAYHDAHEALRYAYNDGSTWDIQIVDSGSDVGEDASLELDSGGVPHIAYTDLTSKAIRYAQLVGTEWQTETVTTMPGAYNITLDLALDSADHPRLCFYDDDPAGDTRFKYAYHDGTVWQFETIDGDVFYNGQECSIALDSQDHPHLSYRDSGLWYAHKPTSWQVTLVDDDFFAGDTSSLVLDHLDRPRIAFSDWDTEPPSYEEQLQYARLDSGWQIETVDVAGETSRYADESLALDADDQPHIAYWDLGPDDLKYAAAPRICCRIYLPIVVKNAP